MFNGSLYWSTVTVSYNLSIRLLYFVIICLENCDKFMKHPLVAVPEEHQAPAVGEGHTSEKTSFWSADFFELPFASRCIRVNFVGLYSRIFFDIK